METQQDLVQEALAGKHGPAEQIRAFALIWQRMHAHMRTWRMSVNGCLPLMEASPIARKELFAICMTANDVCRELDMYGALLVNLSNEPDKPEEVERETLH